MTKQNSTKKHIVASLHNLSPELQEAVREKYPLGFTDEIKGADEIQDDGSSEGLEETDDDIDI